MIFQRQRGWRGICSDGRTGTARPFEFGLSPVGKAVNCWPVRCMATAGPKDLTAREFPLPHHVEQSACGKFAEICFMTDIEDTEVEAYELPKLAGQDLPAIEKRGKAVACLTIDSR